MEPYKRVQLARKSGRPTASAFINKLLTDFIELHGDRRFGDDAAIIAGIGRLGGRPVTVVAQERGVDIHGRMTRNFGSPRPVLCIVDTSGAFCGTGAEERGQGQAIAENLMEMMALRIPVISLFIGEGGSGGALALAVADQVWMLENAVYSVISPEGCASILWKDPSKVKEACACLKMTSEDLLRLGVVERVIPETEGADLFGPLKDQLIQAFERLGRLEAGQRCERRYQRFRKLGVYGE